MINTTLLKKEFKSNYILLLIFLAVLSIYSCMIIAMFDPCPVRSQFSRTVLPFQLCKHIIFAILSVKSRSPFSICERYVWATSIFSPNSFGAIAKLSNTKTGDTLSAKGTPVLYGRTEYSKPYTYMKYIVKNKGDEDKVSQALQKMMAEDVTLRAVNDSENRQTLLYGMGDQHLEIVASKLAARFKCEITLDTPRVAFRETIKKKSDVDTKYKKQSGGHGQYGDVIMEFEPSGDLETPYVFEEKVFGGSVPKNYFPAVEKGLQECVQKGPLAGYPVVGLKATLLDGSYHPVDSSEMAFKMATILAFKQGFMDANPVLLEPIASLKVTVPDRFTGDVMGDLNRRRGRVLGMESNHRGKQVIEADIPMSELFGYNTDLRSMTGGLGDFSYEFSRYEQAPGDVQKKEIEARTAAREE